MIQRCVDPRLVQYFDVKKVGRSLVGGGLVAAAVCMLLTGCHLTSSAGDPAVEFTVVPEAAAGGTDRLAPIAGRVVGARPDQRIVLFAKSGIWWVQPFAAQPFTTIAADSTWTSTIHLGRTEAVAIAVRRASSSCKERLVIAVTRKW